ncbi:CAP domain-containing protein [Paenibacillus mendelii]|uniref:CAP domain-containing protein n=1 Tax=Paenibacillus mendelii TaxID=206163 RepID=A0ABV6JIW5_9BACL|nr:CAP domain-containing protein [Paenibacillus mendelii]MCQ6558786.1 CAP domain-containing protein [Paenibacillus mendelii]
MKKQPFRIGMAGVLAAGMIVLGGGAAVQKADAASMNGAPVTYKMNNSLSQIGQQYGVDLSKLIGSNNNWIWAGINCPPVNNGGSTNGGTNNGTDGGSTNGGSNNGGSTNGGTTNGGSTNGGTTNGGTNGGSTNGGTTNGGTNGGTTNGGSTGTVTQDKFAAEVITLVNAERAKAGLSKLTSDSLLTKVAYDKAKDMYDNNYFDHNSPTYGSPFDMMRAYGVKYSYAGENIAKGQRSPQEVMTAWMNSAGHRANILNKNFNKIGVAYYNGEWVQEFTS